MGGLWGARLKSALKKKKRSLGLVLFIGCLMVFELMVKFLLVS